jgi:hypothetical protein
MTAVVVMASGVSQLAVVAFGGMAVIAGLLVLIAHLAAPKVKRILGAALVAFLMAVTAARAQEDGDGDLIISNPCEKYTSDDPMYWLLGCFWP